ncbi:hypothetical protein M569_04959, partial [Genlisea aurea]
MAASHIRDVLASFSPSLDLFAICIGDGRIKIWDTAKGQLQTELSDITSADATNKLGQAESGRLSMDYKCMKWLSLDKKKKRKLLSSLLVLGTGGGDVLAFDVNSGQLKWRVNDCHLGGVTAVSFNAIASHVYTAGADGVVCIIDSFSGTTLNKFNATSKAISALAVSPDGKTIAAAASQLRIFNSSKQTKLQKFSGHTGPVRCMVFSDDCKYVFSSASSERSVAVWKIDGSKNRQVSALLAMEHPAVFLDSKCSEDGDSDAVSVLAISEIGVGYFWHGDSIDALQNCKPSKIYVPLDDENLKKHRGVPPCLFWAKLQNRFEPETAPMLLVHGLLIKPTFEKVVVRLGADVTLNYHDDGILLPFSQSVRSKKTSDISKKGKSLPLCGFTVTALDRSNMGGALLPVPKLSNLNDARSEDTAMEIHADKCELASATFSVEERLRSLGILKTNDESVFSTLNSKSFKGVNLDVNAPRIKMKETISSMEPSDVLNLFRALVKAWEKRSHKAENVLPWIYSILVYHRYYIKLEDPKLILSLNKFAKSRCSSINSLLQLSGRLQLLLAQIDKGSKHESLPSLREDEGDEFEEDEDEEEEEDVYGVDDDSQTSSDDDD